MNGLQARRGATSRLIVGLLAGLLAVDAFSAETHASGSTDERWRVVEALQSYTPEESVSGTLRLWGHGSFRHDFMRKLVDAWLGEFRRFHPGIALDYRMYGTASAVGAVYTGAGDIALLGEEISPDAARAFRRARGYAHTEISIATGSLDVNYFDYAHMIFVHRDNPLTKLSLAELDGIFGAEHRRSGRRIRTWGELGLTGAWAKKTIQPYGWKTDVDFALFFSGRVLEGSHRWNPQIEEFEHLRREDGTQYDHGQRIIDALAQDRYGIAISNVRYARPEVRALALSWSPEGPWVEASETTLIQQTYPLVRIIPAIIDRPPGGRIAPHVREFLRFVLSREGQRALIVHSGYLPLNARAIAEQLEKLQ